MMASSRMSVGTKSGPVEISTAPDGHSTRTKSETVNADGSTSISTMGADGTGMMVDTSAAGKANYSVDETGAYTTNSASVNGLDPVKVGGMAQHQRIVAASNSMGSSDNWQQVMDTAKRASLTSSEAQGFTTRLDNSMRENWKRSLSDKSSFVHSMSEETRTQLSTSIGAGNVPLLRKVGGAAQLSVIGTNGEQVNFNVSEDVARSFENTASNVRSESLQQTLQDSQSLDYMTRLAKQAGASEAYSYLNDARNMSGSSESYGADLTTALIRNYANERYGSESPENMRQAISDFNHFLTQQGSQGVDNMQSIVEGFVSGHGYGWGSTNGEVNNTIAATHDHVQESGFKHSVGMSSSVAGSLTFNIREANFDAPTSDIPLNNPNTKTVTDPADNIRSRNRVEETGRGGIRTTAGGIAKDMAGLNKFDPPSPTNDLYRNQSFYHQGNLTEPQKQNGGITMPSGRIIYGDSNVSVTSGDEDDFFKGSVFEKK